MSETPNFRRINFCSYHPLRKYFTMKKFSIFTVVKLLPYKLGSLIIIGAWGRRG